jgi:hypothetical protein
MKELGFKREKRGGARSTQVAESLRGEAQSNALPFYGK